MEPEGVRTCRRNIIALAGLLVLAGVTGADPADLDVFGVKPGERAWGVIVIAVVAVAVQVYWYTLKHWHLRVDGKFEDERENFRENLKRPPSLGVFLEQKRANLISNWVAFLLTLGSLYFAVSWIVDAMCG